MITLATLIGNNGWIQHTLASAGSSFFVHAQATTQKKQTFNEDVSLQFFITQDYKMTVEGVIVLTNATGKDLSLTQYDMNLPYFTLKDTKIGYIYPKAFLVDMFSQNNSVLFAFKSQFTRPVVVGKNAQITFTFSAEVVNPYRDIGGMRSLSFPFIMKEEGRNLRITVTIDSKLPLIYAPNVAESLKKKGIYTVTDGTGKLFLFGLSSAPAVITLSHSTEVPVPYFTSPPACTSFEPVSCSGCGEINTYQSPQQSLAQKTQEASKIVFQFVKKLETDCAISAFNRNSDQGKSKDSRFVAGYLISTTTNQLIPATWRAVTTTLNKFYITDVSTFGVPYVYTDSYGYLSIPLYSCLTDEECRKQAETLQTIDSSLGNTTESESSPVKNATGADYSLSIKQEGHSFFYLNIRNDTKRFIQIHSVTLADNELFTLNDGIYHIIPPNGLISLPLEAKKEIQISNNKTNLLFTINDTSQQLVFSPITITILAIIEFLSYLFVVALGITVLSVIGIILYNRRNGKKNFA